MLKTLSSAQKLTTPFTDLGSTNILAFCCLRRAPKLLVGLRLAGVPAPIGVASLSDEAAVLMRTAGSGKMNSCAHSVGNLRLQKQHACACQMG